MARAPDGPEIGTAKAADHRFSFRRWPLSRLPFSEWFGPFLAPDESPAQTLQFLHVAVQAKETQQGHGVPEGRNIEAWLLRDKYKPENGCGEHEAHASQEQNNVADQSVGILRQRRIDLMRNPIPRLH